MKTYIYTIAIAAACAFCSESVSAKVVDAIQGEENGVLYVCYPSGVLDESVQTPALYLTSDYTGIYHPRELGKVAVICGSLPSATEEFRLTTDYNVPEYIYCSGGYPVTALEGCFAYAMAKVIGIPDGITVIGEATFAHSGAIEELTLPASLLRIGKGAFEDMKGLRTLHMRSILPPECEVTGEDGSSLIASLGSGEVEGKSPFEGTKPVIYVPTGSKWLYRMHPVFGKFSIMEYAPEFTPPSGIDGKLLGNLSTGYCGNFSLAVTGSTPHDPFISMPDAVESEDYILGVSMKNFPYMVTAVMGEAFKDSEAIEHLQLPKYLEVIGSRAFENAFSKNALPAFEIPGYVRYIGERAFAGNGSVRRVALRVQNDVEHLLCAPDAFDGTAENATLYVDLTTTAIDLTQAPWNKFKEVRNITEYSPR